MAVFLMAVLFGGRISDGCICLMAVLFGGRIV